VNRTTHNFHELTATEENTSSANILCINAYAVKNASIRRDCLSITLNRRQVASRAKRLLPLVLLSPYREPSSRKAKCGVEQRKRNGNTCIILFSQTKVTSRHLVSNSHQSARSTTHIYRRTEYPAIRLLVGRCSRELPPKRAVPEELGRNCPLYTKHGLYRRLDLCHCYRIRCS
jgi:hypothetical protein